MKVSERYDMLYLLTLGHMVCHMAYHGIRIESWTDVFFPLFSMNTNHFSKTLILNISDISVQ